MSKSPDKKLRAVFFTVLVFLWLFAGTVTFAGSVAAQTDVSGGNSALQDEIDDAGEDETIEVTDSESYDQIIIDREDASGLTIRAADGESPTISHDADNGEPAVAIDQDGITLEGFTIKRSNSNHVAQAVRVAGNNTDLIDNTYELDGSTNDAAVGVLTDSSDAAGNPSFSGTIDDVEISGGEIITKDASQTGVLVADSGDASFGGDGSVSISDVEFTANADSTHVLELDTGGGVVDTSAALDDNTFDTAAEVSNTDADIGFNVDGTITSTIQGAVNYADTDATVEVDSGEYNEDIKIGVDDLTLSGDGEGSTTIIGQGDRPGTVFISADHPGITVSGFRIESGTNDNAVHASTDNEITDVTFSQNTLVASSGGVTAFIGGDHENINFDQNTFTSSGDAVDKHLFLGGQASYGSEQESATADSTENDISNNNFDQYSTNAIEFEGQHGEITGNEFSSGVSDSTAIAIPGAIGEGNSVGIDGKNILINENNFDADIGGLKVAPEVSNTIDVTSNWWGDAAGPDASDNTAVTDGASIRNPDAATYAPWADTKINTDTPDPSLTATAFESGNVKTNAYSNIDSAISDPPGEKINLGVETIEEPVKIDIGDSDKLALRSATDVDATVRVSDNDEGVSDGTPTINVVGSGNGVTLSELTVERIAADDRSATANHAQGIAIRDTDVTIDGVDVTGTLNTGNDFDRFDGIVVLNTGSTSSNINIEGDTTVSGFYAGLVVTETGTQTGGVSADGLTAEDNNDGVVIKSHSEDDAPQDLTVENSDIRNNDRHGVFIVGGSDDADYQEYDLNGADAGEVTVTNSNIINNGGDGVLAEPDTAGEGTRADATENWWGDASGPSGEGPGSGASVSANVDFDPWLDAQAPDGETVSPESLDVTLAETAIDADGQTSVESVEEVLSNGETGRDLTEQATFDSEDSTIASVSEDGTITAESPGSTTITAEADGLEGEVDVRVGLIEGIEVAVEDDRIPVGESTGFTVDGTFTDGSVSEVTDNADLELELVTGEDRATIDADANEVTGDAQGAVTLEATLQGETDTAELDVFREETGDVQNNRVEFDAVESTRSIEFEEDVDDDTEVTVTEGTRPPEDAPELPADVDPVVAPDYEVPEEATDVSATIELDVSEERLDEVGLDEDELESRLTALREEPDGDGYDPVTIVDIDTSGSGATVTIETPGFSTFILGGSSPASGGSGGDDGGGGGVGFSGSGGVSSVVGQATTISDVRPGAPGTTVTFDQTGLSALTFSNENAEGTVGVDRLDGVPGDAPPFSPSRPVAAVFSIDVPDEQADQSATLEFELDADAFGSAGLNPDEAIVLRALDEEYEQLDPDVEVDGDTVSVTVETPGFSTFVVTDDPSADTDADADADTPVPDDGGTPVPGDGTPAGDEATETPDAEATETPEPESLPGFGAGVAVVALLAAALLAARRRTDG